MASGATPTAKPHSAPADHNQYVADPIAHFSAIPWCAELLSSPGVMNVTVPERKVLTTGESNFVRKVMNSATTVRACVTFFQLVNKRTLAAGKKPLSRSTELLQGGGRAHGEDPKNPFILMTALLDLGEDMCSYPGMLHGGLYSVLLDEVMGTVANFQTANAAYTAELNTKYRKPVKTPQVVLVKGRVISREGRKLQVRGTIEDKDGNVLSECQGVWSESSNRTGRSQL